MGSNMGGKDKIESNMKSNNDYTCRCRTDNKQKLMTI